MITFSASGALVIVEGVILPSGEFLDLLHVGFDYFGNHRIDNG